MKSIHCNTEKSSKMFCNFSTFTFYLYHIAPFFITQYRQNAMMLEITE